MLEECLRELVVGLITTALSFLARKVWSFVFAPPESRIGKSVLYSKKTIRNQFLFNLFAFPLLLIIGVSVEHIGFLTMVVKSVALMLSMFSFVLLWGAFDAAFSFYPDE